VIPGMAGPFQHVVMGGGATHGLMYIGVLMAHAGNSRRTYAEWARGIHTFAGSSMGALLAFALTCWDPWQTMQYFMGSRIRDIATRLFDSKAREVWRQKSINSGRVLDAVLSESVAHVAGDADVTFLQLHQSTGKRLVITVTDIVTGGAEYWSHVTAPHVRVRDALRASVAIPGVFPPWQVGARWYTDGGVACNVPCHLFPPESTLTLFVHTPFRGPAPVFMSQILDNYMSAAQLGPFRVLPLYGWHAVPCISVPTLPSPYDFNLTPRAVEELVAHGSVCWIAVLFRHVVFQGMLRRATELAASP